MQFIDFYCNIAGIVVIRELKLTIQQNLYFNNSIYCDAEWSRYSEIKRTAPASNHNINRDSTIKMPCQAKAYEAEYETIKTDSKSAEHSTNESWL